MVKKIVLPICVAVLLTVLGNACHREPVQPTPPPDASGFTVEPITENGVETGYSLSYRSWIVPGTGAAGNKSTKSAKSDSKANDTVSVILHDEFYHVDTIGYVSDWMPEKYENGSYTCHWDKYAVPRAPEDYVTIVDSTSILRIQFEEFSFSYRINFEVATYDNGVIRKEMPHYTPVITDLGVTEEMETLETICRNDSVFARRVLHHAVKVTVGPKSEILHAKVTLYRYLPFDPNKFVVRSELIGNITETYIPTDSLATYYPKWQWNLNVRVYWSDGSVEDMVGSPTLTIQILDENSSSLVSAPYVDCDVMQTYTYSHMTSDNVHTYFHYTGTEYTPMVKFHQDQSVSRYNIWDDGYTCLWDEIPSVRLEYARTRYFCTDYSNYLYAYANIVVNDVPQQEIRTSIGYGN